MAYKIAIASSDGINLDIHFGAAQSFLIYAVKDDFLHKKAILSCRGSEGQYIGLIIHSFITGCFLPGC